jgi:N utilization substance protein A
MTKTSLIDALKEVIGEKNLPMEVLVHAIEEALVVAYRKNFDSDEDVSVKLDEQTGDLKVISRPWLLTAKNWKNRTNNTPLKKPVK